MFSHKTCLILTMLRPSRQQRPLRSNFAPTWGGTSHLVPPHRCAVRRGIKSQKLRYAMLWPACPSNPSGHFGHSRCLQRMRSTFWSFERTFAWAVQTEQVLMGKLKSILLMVSAQTTIFFAIVPVGTGTGDSRIRFSLSNQGGRINSSRDEASRKRTKSKTSVLINLL
jgi:hypothetical protein